MSKMKGKSRKPVKPSVDKKIFSKTSVNHKKVNFNAPMYRGGIRF